MKKLHLILCVSLFIAMVSCEENVPELSTVLSLSEIPDLENHGEISFIDTKWRLLGFGEESSNRIRLAERRDSENQLWLLFNDNGTFEGFSTGNILSGNYSSIGDNQIEVLDFFVTTSAGELTDDGYKFTEKMKHAYMGEVSKKGFIASYQIENKTNYMLFRPLVP